MTDRGKSVSFWTGIFVGGHDGQFRKSAEVSEIQKIPIPDLLQLMEKIPDLFVPAFVWNFKEIESRFAEGTLQSAEGDM